MDNMEFKDKLKRVVRWIEKSNSNDDSFDKFISLFIAFNMFYSLYALYKNPKAVLEGNDKQNALATAELLNKIDFFDRNSRIIGDFSDKCQRFIVEVSGKDASDQLKAQIDKEEKENVIDLSFEMLYKIRCNLVHGEKEYHLSQGDLLGASSMLLRAYLGDLLSKFEERLNNS
jgi:hypothetical protein